ncbi:MAG: hypothetical protein KDK08_05580 [Rhizobiaceae bacterium]|nr:hypothetical protein [Rhizobiaceae bacterium]MCC0000939.1 hypothetical protein [Methylobacteriaceae bacterium]
MSDQIVTCGAFATFSALLFVAHVGSIFGGLDLVCMAIWLVHLRNA